LPDDAGWRGGRHGVVSQGPEVPAPAVAGSKVTASVSGVILSRVVTY